MENVPETTPIKPESLRGREAAPIISWTEGMVGLDGVEELKGLDNWPYRGLEGLQLLKHEANGKELKGVEAVKFFLQKIDERRFDQKDRIGNIMDPEERYRRVSDNLNLLIYNVRGSGPISIDRKRTPEQIAQEYSLERVREILTVRLDEEFLKDKLPQLIEEMIGRKTRPFFAPGVPSPYLEEVWRYEVDEGDVPKYPKVAQAIEEGNLVALAKALEVYEHRIGLMRKKPSLDKKDQEKLKGKQGTIKGVKRILAYQLEIDPKDYSWDEALSLEPFGRQLPWRAGLLPLEVQEKTLGPKTAGRIAELEKIISSS